MPITLRSGAVVRVPSKMVNEDGSLDQEGSSQQQSPDVPKQDPNPLQSPPAEGGSQSKPIEQPGHNNGDDLEDTFHDARQQFSSMPMSRIPLPKMPAFNTKNADEWFQRLNVQMRLIGARTENDKYRCLLSYLDDVLLVQVDLFIADEEAKCPVTTPFTLAQTHLLNRFRKSTRQVIESMLKMKPKEEDLPSTFLRTLQRTAGPENATLAREIWEDSWPDHITAAMQSLRDLPDDVVAKAADAITIATQRKPRAIPAPVQAATPSQIYMMDEALVERVEKLEVFLTQKNFQPRHTKTPQKPKTETNNANESSLCIYHRRYGAKARKCECAPKN